MLRVGTSLFLSSYPDLVEMDLSAGKERERWKNNCLEFVTIESGALPQSGTMERIDHRPTDRLPFSLHHS